MATSRSSQKYTSMDSLNPDYPLIALLKRRMKDKNYTQIGLAVASGTHQPVISRLMNGHPPQDAIYGRILECLDLSLSDALSMRTGKVKGISLEALDAQGSRSSRRISTAKVRRLPAPLGAKAALSTLEGRGDDTSDLILDWVEILCGFFGAAIFRAENVVELDHIVQEKAPLSRPSKLRLLTPSTTNWALEMLLDKKSVERNEEKSFAGNPGFFYRCKDWLTAHADVVTTDGADGLSAEDALRGKTLELLIEPTRGLGIRNALLLKKHWEATLWQLDSDRTCAFTHRIYDELLHLGEAGEALKLLGLNIPPQSDRRRFCSADDEHTANICDFYIAHDDFGELRRFLEERRREAKSDQVADCYETRFLPHSCMRIEIAQVVAMHWYHEGNSDPGAGEAEQLVKDLTHIYSKGRSNGDFFLLHFWKGWGKWTVGDFVAAKECFMYAQSLLSCIKAVASASEEVRWVERMEFALTTWQLRVRYSQAVEKWPVFDRELLATLLRDCEGARVRAEETGGMWESLSLRSLEILTRVRLHNGPLLASKGGDVQDFGRPSWSDINVIEEQHRALHQNWWHKVFLQELEVATADRALDRWHLSIRDSEMVLNRDEVVAIKADWTESQLRVAKQAGDSAERGTTYLIKRLTDKNARLKLLLNRHVNAPRSAATKAQ